MVHTGCPHRGFFESLFYSEPPEGKGVRLPLDKRNSTPVFLSLPGAAEFPCWHIPWALELGKLAVAGGEETSASPHRAEVPRERPVRSRGCEELQIRRETGADRGPEGKRERLSNFLGEETLLLSSRPRTPAFLPFSNACTFCVCVLHSQRVSNVQSRENSLPAILQPPGTAPAPPLAGARIQGSQPRSASVIL